jgi:hypothetical protein
MVTVCLVPLKVRTLSWWIHINSIKRINRTQVCRGEFSHAWQTSTCIIQHIPLYVYIQQDESLHSLFISGKCSTCFGWYFHPSSGAHTTVSTAFGICHAVTATCHYRGRQLLHDSAGSSNGLTNTKCCRYSSMRSWWWVEVPPETCRAVSRYK